MHNTDFTHSSAQTTDFNNPAYSSMGLEFSRTLSKQCNLQVLPLGDSPEMQQVRLQIEQVAGFDATVLISGASGSGKEVVAKQIHEQSERADQPFIAINCGAIPEDLLESELFGHEKGAFTGALSARIGRFEMAQGGTLFLDEIGDMPLMMQVKLLRVLQEKCFERVGGNKSIPSDVRVIAASHRNLEQMIQTNQFREDLFYRLNVFPIHIPALKARKQDIPLLFNYFMQQLDESLNIQLSDEVSAVFQTYDWPGNVRELQNLVQRLAIVRPEGFVQVDDLPVNFKQGISKNLVQHKAHYSPLQQGLNEVVSHNAPPHQQYSSDLQRLLKEPCPSDIAAAAYQQTSANTYVSQSPSDVEPMVTQPELDEFLESRMSPPLDVRVSQPTTLETQLYTEHSATERVASAATSCFDVHSKTVKFTASLPTSDSLDLKATLQALESQYIELALEKTGGVVAKAARLLGLRRTTLVEKMKKLSIKH